MATAQQSFSTRSVQFLDELNGLRPDLIVLDRSALRKYAHDSWPLSTLRELKGDPGTLPRAALVPKTTEEVSTIIRLANKFDIPLVIFGAGSNVTGAAAPQSEECAVLDMEKMNRIEELKTEDMTVTVQSGMMLKDLETHLNGSGYTLRHFPQSYNLASIGGLIATNSIGQYSTKYGGIESMVLNLEMVLPDGTTAWLKNGVTTPRSAVGPDLKFLIEGSEGMFGVVTRAVLRILPIPEHTWMRAFRFQNFGDGLHALKELMLSDLVPAVARLYDGAESEIRFQTEEPTLVLLYEHNSAKVLDAVTEGVLSKLGEHNAKDVGEEPAREWLESRFEFQREIDLVKAINAWFDTIEVATTWSNLPQLYKDFKSEVGGIEGVMGVLAHASHIYTSGGCIYFSVIFSQDEELYWKIWDAAAKVCRDNHATLSHHHGVGRLKRKYAKEELGEVSFEILSNLKRTLDKNRILNSDLWLGSGN